LKYCIRTSSSRDTAVIQLGVTTTTTTTTTTHRRYRHLFRLARVLLWRDTTQHNTTIAIATTPFTTILSLFVCFTSVSLPPSTLPPSMARYLADQPFLGSDFTARQGPSKRYAVPDPTDRAACARFRMRRREASRRPDAQPLVYVSHHRQTSADCP
jgi:hypothetical protein